MLEQRQLVSTPIPFSQEEIAHTKILYRDFKAALSCHERAQENSDVVICHLPSEAEARKFTRKGLSNIILDIFEAKSEPSRIREGLQMVIKSYHPPKSYKEFGDRTGSVIG